MVGCCSNHFDVLYMLYFHGWIWFKMTRTSLLNQSNGEEYHLAMSKFLGFVFWLEWYQGLITAKVFFSREIQHWKKKGRETGHIQTMWHRLLELCWWYLVLLISLISISSLSKFHLSQAATIPTNSPLAACSKKIRWPGSLGWIGCTSEICDFGKLHQQFLGSWEKMMQASLHLLVTLVLLLNLLDDFISKINTWSHSERAIVLLVCLGQSLRISSECDDYNDEQ